MTAGSLANLEGAFGDAPMPRIAAAYRFFWRKITGFANGSADSEPPTEELPREIQVERLEALYHSLQTSLQFVVIELEDRDDPQVIFETLNARGQPLLPSDLIRNFIFLQASGTTDIDKLYNVYWKDFDEKVIASTSARFWHVEERQGRLVRPRIDLFIFHYLTMTTEKPDLKNRRAVSGIQKVAR
jgi:hypothetical protein